ncbi:MAG TPA: hypothetical protein IGS17_12880 [Oscillatoriales cyanobacterium M59_W2019_021]|nr:MAG: hypothetical protein D6728_20315 [Cyanobacteria bacterium J055]HIK51798.1 hypothetical protein [Oscillatoriales cyanobacterium M59_W2019_021]
MRSDLKALYITSRELKEITGMEDDSLDLYEVTHAPRQLTTLLVKSSIETIVKRQKSKVFKEVFQWFFVRKTMRTIFDKIYNYNKLIKAIDINDRLEDAGNTSLRLSDREKVIEVLQCTRNDMIRALKTERILRENKKFIDSNPHIFATNLTALPHLQVSEQASEYGRILDETLKVAVDIQSELKKLGNG